MIYYDHPVQVRINDQDHTYYGIAYQDYLIWGDNGELTLLDNLIARNEDKAIDDVIVELEWLSLEDAIHGEDQ